MNEYLKRQLNNASKEKDPLKKSLLVLAILTEALKPEDIKPVLVGGRALEFYTLGGYATRDMDLVINGRNKAQTLLQEMGFSKRPGERHWYHEELDLALEIPGDNLAGSMDKLVSLELNGMEAYIIGVEDLVIDRLTAAKFWQSHADFLWAAKLMALHSDDLDQEYLRQAAHKSQVEDILDKALAQSRTYLIE